MQKEIGTLVIGGSYFGVGYASAHPDCAILETSQILGCDFHRGIRTADLSGVEESEAGTELGKLMEKHHVIENGKFDVLKAAPVLHEYCAQSHIKIIMDAKLLAVEKQETNYFVRYATNSGIHDIHCKNILDTTVLRDTYPEGKKCIAKTLNIFSICVGDSFDRKIKETFPECVIENGFCPREKIVRISFPAEKSLPDAYEETTVCWGRAFPNGEEKILFIAQDFDYVCDRINEESAPCAWIKGVFPNPLSAFAAGRRYE